MGDRFYEALRAATVSCTGKEITISCLNHEVKDTIMDELLSPGGSMVVWIGEVAEAIGWQAGVGSSETAGMIISCLCARPDLIPDFLKKGSGLLVDGDIAPDKGCLTFHRLDGKVTTPQELRMSRQARKLLNEAGAVTPAQSNPVEKTGGAA
jgi:hypothetical protein